MKKDDQNSSPGNPPDSDSSETSSSQHQQADNNQIIAPLEETLAPLLELIAPIAQAFAPIIQNVVPVLHYLFGPWQHITFSVAPAPFPDLETPRNYEIVPSPGNISRSASTLVAQSFPSQQIDRPSTSGAQSFHSQHFSTASTSGAQSFHSQHISTASTSGAQSFPSQQIYTYPSGVLLPILPTPLSGSYLQTQTTSISEECRQHFPSPMDSPSKRQKKKFPSPSKKQKTGTSSTHNESLFSASAEATESKEQMTDVHPRQEEEATSPTKEASTSKGQMTAIHSRQKTGAVSSPGQEASSSKEQMTAIHPKQKKEGLFTPVEATYVSRGQLTTECLKQKTGRTPIHEESKSSSLESSSQHFHAPLDTLSASGEQCQTYELSSSSKKQKTRTFSWPTDSQFASRKHETAQGTKQKAKTFSHPVEVETFASRKKESTVSYGNEKEKQSTSVETMSASIEQVSSEQLDMSTQTGLQQTVGDPKSLSPDSRLKDSFSKDNKVHQGTGFQKDVDPVAERPSQSDQFICVVCKARFPTQEKLSMHELTHFTD